MERSYNTPKLHRGDIYYISKTVSYGAEMIAGRPGIIVSNDINNANSTVVEVVYLTTKYKTAQPTHVLIDSAGARGTALCEQIQTVSIDKIGDYVGHCTPEEMRDLDKALAASIGITKVEIPTKEAENHNTNKAEIERDLYKKLYEQLLETILKK